MLSRKDNFVIMKKYQQGEKCLLLGREQSRAFDAWAINVVGVPGPVLMENAGRSCAELIAEKLVGKTSPRVCIFCGPGNNGGDGFVIARHLLNRNFSVATLICGDPDKIKGDAKINLDILKALNAKIERLDISNTNIIKSRIAAFAKDADMLVDAVFGTGLAGQLRDDSKMLIEAINALGKPILAVDIPSGLDCDTGLPLGASIKAKWTVTFAAVKKGFALETAREFTGEIYVASIGVVPAFNHRA
ncbi:MAG: NAD(P)H-hydrate epimerase [Sedimentisphaerales bacterium]